MSDIAIRAEGLSKRYQLGERETYRTLSGTIGRLLRSDGAARSEREYLWAIRDIDLEIEAGTAVGLVGSNGAGKSTLLKVLSQITRPTRGEAELRGRVGSLLEVGTGFHPELTGRENVFMNGAILGMRKTEIESKLDDIVDFAELGQFIDTPVKHYSSGMYVRLAFAVAAHLEPEILLVDEVLAVGDAAFQRRCLGKMDDVTSGGRTIIFVSHNMPAITRLCSRAVWVDKGRVQQDGPADDVVRSYLETASETPSRVHLAADDERPMRLRGITIGEGRSPLEMTEPIDIRVEYDVNRRVAGCHVIVFVHTADGVNVLGTGDADADATALDERAPGSYVGHVQLPGWLLGEGRYHLTVTLGVPFGQIHDRHEAVASFEVVDEQSQRRQWIHRRRPGILGIEPRWNTTTRSID